MNKILVTNNLKRKVFVDLFCGSLSVPLGLGLPFVFACDINFHLINFWKKVREGFPIPHHVKMLNTEGCYYTNRNTFNRMIKDPDTVSSPATAELFYYLVKTGFNGLWRVNSSGKFNVPFGKHNTVNYKVDTAALSSIMKNWHIVCRGYDYHMERWVGSTTLYSDPPYYGVGHNAYHEDSFTWDDHCYLASKLGQHEGPVIAHNSGLPEVIELYKTYGFDIHLVNERRSISSDATTRSGVECIVATRNVDVNGIFGVQEEAQSV